MFRRVELKIRLRRENRPGETAGDNDDELRSVADLRDLIKHELYSDAATENRLERLPGKLRNLSKVDGKAHKGVPEESEDRHHSPLLGSDRAIQAEISIRCVFFFELTSEGNCPTNFASRPTFRKRDWIPVRVGAAAVNSMYTMSWLVSTL